jgi:hypothetical protein
MSDMFPIKNGLKQRDALSTLFFNFVLNYAIRKVQVNKDGLNLMVNISFFMLMTLIYWVEAYILKEPPDAVVIAVKEISREVNAVKTKYMFISRDQNAGRSRTSGTIKIFGNNLNESKFYSRRK